MKIIQTIFNKNYLDKKNYKKSQNKIVPELQLQSLVADYFAPTGICEYKKCGFREIGQHSFCIHPIEYTIIEKEKSYALPEYFITMIKADVQGLGYGTSAIKSILKKSLNDPSSKGRVCLYADSISKNSKNEMVYPAGFYYKLGFRFTMPGLNEFFENWLKSGGEKKLAPKMHGVMYLPKKNILHCLNY